jgi:uncharacterized membrane protein YozB (DUF420 family)
MAITNLPSLNAALNAASALLLTAGLLCIRAKRITAHTWLMLGASVSSALFLTSYLIYHAHVGSVRFLGTGWIRPLYLALLSSHTLLAVAIVPLVLRTLFLAGHKRFKEHVAIARWTWPLWLYVSVTGIAVYWLLYHANVAEACPGCKEALLDPGELPQRLSMARGYAMSIGLLLLVPFGLVGILAALIARAHRRRPGGGPLEGSGAEAG